MNVFDKVLQILLLLKVTPSLTDYSKCFDFYCYTWDESLHHYSNHNAICRSPYWGLEINSEIEQLNVNTFVKEDPRNFKILLFMSCESMTNCRGKNGKAKIKYTNWRKDVSSVHDVVFFEVGVQNHSWTSHAIIPDDQVAVICMTYEAELSDGKQTTFRAVSTTTCSPKTPLTAFSYDTQFTPFSSTPGAAESQKDLSKSLNASNPFGKGSNEEIFVGVALGSSCAVLLALIIITIVLLLWKRKNKHTKNTQQPRTEVPNRIFHDTGRARPLTVLCDLAAPEVDNIDRQYRSSSFSVRPCPPVVRSPGSSRVIFSPSASGMLNSDLDLTHMMNSSIKSQAAVGQFVKVTNYRDVYRPTRSSSVGPIHSVGETTYENQKVSSPTTSTLVYANLDLSSKRKNLPKLYKKSFTDKCTYSNFHSPNHFQVPAGDLYSLPQK